jgi:predicted nuclease of predicted toxin-antitoxin system
VSVSIKVDEDLPSLIADLFNARGHQAMTVLQQGWQGSADDVLWTRVQAEGRWFITADKGFGDLRKHPPGSHAGVILLRSSEQSRRAYVDLASTIVDRLDFEEIAGGLVVVTQRGVRIRRASRP